MAVLRDVGSVKLTEEECREALRAYGMDPTEIQALFDLVRTDPTVQALFTMWCIGERTLPKTMTQLVLYLGREKAVYLRQAIDAVAARPVHILVGCAGTGCVCAVSSQSQKGPRDVLPL